MSDTDYIMVNEYYGDSNIINKNKNDVIDNFDGVYAFSNENEYENEYDLSDKPLDDKTVESLSINEGDYINASKDTNEVQLDMSSSDEIDEVSQVEELVQEKKEDIELLQPPPCPTYAENSMKEIIRIQQLKQLELIKRSTTLTKMDKNYLCNKQLKIMNEIDKENNIEPSMLQFGCEGNLFTNIFEIVVNDLITLFN
jgi:hypothetical protein